MTRLTARTSTIFIATDQDTRVYRSFDEIPPALRRKLQQTTRGLNSATILIADRRGRQELMGALQGRATDIHSRVLDTLRAKQGISQVLAEPAAEAKANLLRLWLEVLLPCLASASLWFFLQGHF
jgi:hypothetical protein